MGKCIAYVAAAVVFLGLGALIAGLAVWYSVPEVSEKFTSESRLAKCVLESSSGVSGTIMFRESSEPAPVDITGNITGLSPGKHGFHIHAFGVSGADCKAAGGHYNPFGSNHSAPDATQRHVGDLGNILAGEDSVAHVDILDDTVTLFGWYSVLGRAVVVHAGEDDLGLGGNDGSLSTGNAGGRVACCTIFAVPE
ncbi:superoxide dismutase [Cu-Zn]-like [Penaeus monodon]|uniref:superoxide dismutase [Cu-Zn]-like n=1 Tax=Penaeus monodon TaxID=6687 RepID=UPI0018A7E052|nr:superoxide dismutase [Cu-Zn]-like [Penaeus monodon]